MDLHLKNPENLAYKAKAEKYAKITAKTIINSGGFDSAAAAHRIGVQAHSAPLSVPLQIWRKAAICVRSRAGEKTGVKAATCSICLGKTPTEPIENRPFPLGEASPSPEEQEALRKKE